jgi:hypothetical protein
MATTANGVKAQSRDATKQRPVFEARFGRLRVSVWRQESDKGPWFNVVLSRSYKDESGQWQTANSFGARDLLEVAKLCDVAHTWVYRELAKERAQDGHSEVSEEDVPF